MIVKKTLFLISAGIYFLLSCDLMEGKKVPLFRSQLQVQKSDLYDLSYPDTVFYLERKLLEVSGLSYSNRNAKLLAINDEKGIIYTVSQFTGKIVDESVFSDDGDYEGIASVDSLIYVLQSDGDIFKVENGETKKAETKLKQAHDVEGLCFYNNALLMACKSRALDKDDKNIKAIYKFNLAKDDISETPYLMIDRDTLVDWYDKNHIDNVSKYAMKRALSRVSDFSPSGIAVHPHSEDLYILSAKGSSLVIYDKHLKLREIVLLNDKQIRQPEGITFDENATLYIATEGKALVAKLFVYAQK